ncbi:MAG: cobalamin B12-binding domain-containing protein [Chitinophagaceae bacterium]|nr:cobalamin B12-binding domain-containing protein [Chitinophagaceae bacterium]
MNEFTIRDLENLSGIKAHTIRIWEQRYTFLKPRRSGTNIRYYSSGELKTVLNISLLNKYGFKISHINKMSPDTMKETIHSLTQAGATQERIINDLLHCMIDLDTESFEELLDEYIYSNGIDKSIGYLVFPFLQRIGILWVTDHIKVAQEHLVTNVIRQKLIMGIQNASPLQKAQNSVVLFLPQGEYHELGLLYVHYLLKIRGVKVLYLGADVPLEDIVFVCDMKSPNYIYTHLTCLPARLNFEKYLEEMHQRLKNVPVVISGKVVNSYYRKVPPSVTFKKTLTEVLEQLVA